ncbi:hypothetical protein VSU01S_29590 [Vibrio superstes NBRC 103154]|uniref:Uncharacterized protein n=1 Tax=Vibrio superstes NBRC 103154 TaxID=1219062 RepID=A0A511QTP3_9VIBR|nr:hypothetical protein VSU01S_29590 [Vibrio superstes NBRC 103154]
MQGLFFNTMISIQNIYGSLAVYPLWLMLIEVAPFGGLTPWCMSEKIRDGFYNEKTIISISSGSSSGISGGTC